jgi:hypothetical protein
MELDLVNTEDVEPRSVARNSKSRSPVSSGEVTRYPCGLLAVTRRPVGFPWVRTRRTEEQ